MVPFNAPSLEVIRVLVADNTRMHTQLLDGAINHDPGLRVVVSVSNGSDLLAAAEVYDFDVALVSSSLEQQPDCGLHGIRELHLLRPQSRIVVLLDSARLEDTLEAFRSGARGTFTRHESVESLRKCIRVVHSGEIWANRHQISYIVETLASTPSVQAVDSKGMDLLSTREMDVVRNVAAGLTNRQIAAQLGLSQHTIKNYLFRIYDKLGVSSRVELLYMTLAQDSALSNQGRKQPGDGPGVANNLLDPDSPSSYAGLTQLDFDKFRRA
jgi:DNA-binding NarL/FixJ family response regulator